MDFLYQIILFVIDLLPKVAITAGIVSCIVLIFMGRAVPKMIERLGGRKKFPDSVVFSFYATLAFLLAVILIVQFPTVF